MTQNTSRASLIMIFTWSMPRFREPLWIEYIIDDCLNCTAKHLGRPLRGTLLAYWLLDAESQVSKHLVTTALAILIGLAWSIFQAHSVRKASRITPLLPTGAKANVAEQAQSVNVRSAPTILQPDHAVRTPLHAGNSMVHSLAPADRVPTHANLDGSLSSLARPLGSADSTGRISTPRYQTPFGIPTHSRNYSSLARTAPVSYETLQDTGMLNWDGTPTKKWDTIGRVQGSRIAKGMGPVKNIVAGLRSDLKQSGRAEMRLDLDEEDDGVALML